jgi:hypothetical protein
MSLLPIVALLLHGGPAAIRWAVSLGVIDPIHRQAKFKTWTHVVNEVFKFHPPVADGDTFSAVETVSGVTPLKTPEFYSFPDFVELYPYIIKSSPNKPLPSFSFTQAPTGLYISSIKISNTGNLIPSTVTRTKPIVPLQFSVTRHPKRVNGLKKAKLLASNLLALLVKLADDALSHKTSSFRWLVSASMQPNTALGRAHFNS